MNIHNRYPAVSIPLIAFLLLIFSAISPLSAFADDTDIPPPIPVESGTPQASNDGDEADDDVDKDLLIEMLKEQLRSKMEEDVPSVSELVLPPEYFEKAVNHEYVLDDPGAPAGLVRKQSMRDLIDGNTAIAQLAAAMNEVANRDLLDSTAYREAWADKESELMLKFRDTSLPSETAVILTPNSVKIVTMFLSQWRKDAMQKAPNDFDLALKQAAASLTRVYADLEKEWIEKVKGGTASPSTSYSSNRGTSGGYYGGSTYSGSAYAGQGIHGMMMRHMNYKHERRMTRIRSGR